MSVAVVGRENNRLILMEAIIRVLESWPSLHRQVFIQAHYAGQSASQVACSLGVGVEDVRAILDHCGRSLRASLRAWREGKQDCGALGKPLAAAEARKIAC